MKKNARVPQNLKKKLCHNVFVTIRFCDFMEIM